MTILPFNKWTLKFDNQEYERLYQTQMNGNRLKYFRILGVLTMLVCTALFVIYLINGESVFAVVAVALMIVAIFIALLNSHKLQKQMSYIYCFMYVVTISVSLFLATQYLRKSLYVLGFSTSSITAVSSLFCHYSLRIPLFALVPTLQLYTLEAYNMQDLQFIILIFFSQIQFAIYAHHNEYMNRLQFSCQMLNEKYKNIIQQFVPSSLFIVSLNQRTYQLELQFKNNQSQALWKADDTKTMINVFRNILIAPKGQMTTISDLQNINLQKSGEQSLRKGGYKRQTLEEFAFYKIKEAIDRNQDSNEDEDEMDGIYYDEKDQINKTISILSNKILCGKNMLLIIINEVKQSLTSSKDDEQIRFLAKIIQYLSQQMQTSQQQIFLAIKSLTGQVELDKLWKFKCQQLSLMNKFENFIVFLNQNETAKEQNPKQVYLKSFISNLEKYLVNMAIYQNKKFCLRFDMDDQLIKVSTKFLTQIIINVYEQALCHSSKNCEIKLAITAEENLNPLQSLPAGSCQKRSLQEFDFIKKVNEEVSESSTKKQQQKLIKFEFSFQSKSAVELEPSKKFILNPLTLEEFANNNSQEFSLIHPITNFLLQKIGPYNTIQTTQQVYYMPNLQQQSALILFPSMMDLTQQSETYFNTLSFYIYTDQTQLTQSFVKFIRQRSFLDN